MLRFVLALLVALCASTAMAQCPGGKCPRPVRSIVTHRGPSHLPRIAPPIRPITAPQHSHHGRRHRSGWFPGKLFGEIRFRPSR
jgi:hypothetical protein